MLRKKYGLRAFNNSVIRKLNPNRDEVMELWGNCIIYSSFYVFTKW